MNSAVDQMRLEANQKLDPRTKGALGQFMTPYRIAEFMASLFTVTEAAAVLLDAGAGIGSLSIAASRVLNLKRIEAWEIDAVMQAYLQVSLDDLKVPHLIHKNDFIHDSVDRLQFNVGARFTHAILNPPYKKMTSASSHRQLLSSIGIETVNLYTAFLALAILQMEEAGEIVAIIPRSFCNGPYYKPFRQFMLEKCRIDRIHVFESRTKAFQDDAVLQENIILKLTRGAAQSSVDLSFSHDSSLSDVVSRSVEFQDVVKPGDKELFIHIPDQADAEQSGSLFLHTLAELNLAVCTGPVVDFRLKEWWSSQALPGTVPLIYPHHFTAEGFEYPRAHKKPNALVAVPDVNKWLMPRGFYVLVKRFSAKEERRRVVAYLISPSDLEAALIGFENHWNVLHFAKKGLAEDIAKGLTCFLNSSLLDRHFRVFSGHTQVNATDLRNMKYPSLSQLRSLGECYKSGMGQDEIDALIDMLGNAA